MWRSNFSALIQAGNAKKSLLHSDYFLLFRTLKYGVMKEDV